MLFAQRPSAVAVALSVVLPTYVSIAMILLILLHHVFAPPIPFLSRY